MSAEEAGRIARAAERMRRSTRLPLKVLLPTTAALGAGGALAAAAIPGSNGVITGCYNTSTAMADVYTFDANGESDVPMPEYGAVRVIDPSANAVTDAILWNDTTTTVNAYNNQCAPYEKTITWNQQGPTGATGATGAAGSNGQNGSIEGAATFEIDASGGTELFAKLPNITGTAKIEQQNGLIPLESFAFGAVDVGIGTGSAAGSGARSTVQTFELVKKIDKTSPTLFSDLQANKTLSKMVVEADHVARKGAAEDAVYTLADVRLKSITQNGRSETVIGVFTKLESSIGTGSSKIEQTLNPGAAADWNLTQNKAN